jgi:multidrug efflux system membrane fusion protein
VDVKTGAIRLKAEARNADNSLWPGQFLRVGLTIETRENAVVIPTRAVLDGVSGPYVYVVADGKAEARQITPGPIVEDETVVDKGLAPGEMVVTDGQIRLAPGVRAEIQTTAAPDDKGQAAPAEAKPADGQPAGPKPAEAKPTGAKAAGDGARS